MPFSLKPPTQIGSGRVQYAGFGEFQDPQIVPTITNGSLALAVSPTYPGDYYTAAPAITITDRGTGTTAAPTSAVATATAALGAGSITSTAITAGGHFYTAAPAVTISGVPSSGGTSALATANLGTGVSAGMVTSLTVSPAGTNYTATPTIAFANPTNSVNPGATALLGNGYVIAVTTSSTQPNGYTAPPAIVFTGGGGSGAAAVADIDQISGNVLRVRVTNPGTGFTSAPTVSVGAAGAVNAITATAVIAAQVVSVGSVTGFGFTSTPMVAVASPQAVVLYQNAPAIQISDVEDLEPIGQIASTADVLQWTYPNLFFSGTFNGQQFGKSMILSNPNSLIVVTRTASTLTKGLPFSASWIGS